jgi:simple sugar transport system permease protein
VERAGILNLGIEGMMVIGAFFGFVAGNFTKNPYLGFTIGMLAGGLASLVFAFISITLKGNQIVTGLALTIFGLGITNFYGQKWINTKLAVPAQSIAIPGLSNIPVIGPVFFNQDVFVYLSYIIAIAFWIILFRTKSGVYLRAVGENARAADAMGISVDKTRYFWTFVGGLLAGAGGAYLTIVYAPFWLDGITAGRGWIAIALVIFAMWNPLYAIVGAYLFGGINALQFQLQATGSSIPSSLLSMQPYLLTLIVVIVATFILRAKHIGVPKELALPFFREER